MNVYAPWLLPILDFVGCALVLCLAVWAPGAVSGIARPFERALRNLGNRRRTAVLLVFALTLGIRVALLPFIPVPDPVAHDEFSYFLQADTFASGRVTNPTHPLWVHFESFHINQVPTYQSMYLPAQGLLMAASERLTGNAWIGVLLSVAAMCAAITWALQAWMAPPWALLGGCFAVARLATNNLWINYMGGALSAVGGALVVGAAGRLRRRVRIREALLLAAGLALLANTRPYEGLLLAAPVLLWLVWCHRSRLLTRALLVRGLLPASLVLAVVGAGMLFYFWRSTGHPLLMPYVVNFEQYHISPPFLWQRIRPIPHYDHAVMREFYERWEIPYYFVIHRPTGFLYASAQKAFVTYGSLLWPWGTLGLIGMAGLALRGPRWWLGLLAVFGVGIEIEAWRLMPHYEAPAIVVFMAVLVYGARYLRAWRRQSGLGLRLERATLLIGAMLVLGGVLALALAPVEYPEPWSVARARISHQLEHTPGRQLVIVQYSVLHSPLDEWVYNAADIDGSKVVWARDMGAARNEELFRYFRDRTVWVVHADDPAPRPERLLDSPSDMLLAGTPAFPSHNGAASQ